MIEPFEYRVRRKKKPIVGKQTPKVAVEKEQLLGEVKGFPATDIEERFARALDKRGIAYMFRFALGEYGTERGDPGWKELDFLVDSFGFQPVEIDDITFIHRGRQDKDRLKDTFIMEYLKAWNPRLVVHVTNFQLETQDLADKTVKEMFG